MSFTYYDWMTLPGPQAARETAENNFLWGRPGQARLSYGVIVSGSARDASNTGTGGQSTILRAGLAMAQKTSDLKYYPWDPTQTDGRQFLAGFQAFPLKVIDGDGNNKDCTSSIVVGGQVKNAFVFQTSTSLNSGGVTAGMRSQAAGRFLFDDDLINQYRMFPYRGEQSKTASYTFVASDSGQLTDNAGAAGAITLTLPALASSYGLFYGVSVQVDQTVTVSSAEGTNIVAQGNASASNVALSTPGNRIGGLLMFYANPGASKWICEVDCNNPITVS